MTVRSRRKAVGCVAAAAALCGTLLTGSASAAPVAPDGPVVISNVAMGNYLIPDNCSGNGDTYLQVYYNANHPCLRTFSFEPVQTRHGETVFTLHTAGNSIERCAQKDGGDGTYVQMRQCDQRNKAQWWLLLTRDGGRTWAIVPYADEGLALMGQFGDDNVAPLRERPGNDATDAQRWFLTPEDQL